MKELLGPKLSFILMLVAVYFAGFAFFRILLMWYTEWPKVLQQEIAAREQGQRDGDGG